MRIVSLSRVLGLSLAVLGLCAIASRAEEPAPKEGTLTGVLTAKGEAWIEVKADGADAAKRYLPVWRGGLPKDGGGFDRDTLAAIKKLVVPNRVRLAWKADEHLRIVGVEQLSPPEKSGTTAGVVNAKGETWLELKTADGALVRYWPRWIGGAPKDGGGFDKAMLETIAKTAVGAQVSVKWTYDERNRVIGIE